jgi:acyl dehydratase
MEVPLRPTRDELVALVGRELGPTDWIGLTAERVAMFDAATVSDPAREPNVHGLMTLALVVPFWERLVATDSFSRVLNYGLDRVRFPVPVPIGNRVRGRFWIDTVASTSDGGLQATIRAIVECEGAAKPACAAELILRVYY